MARRLEDVCVCRATIDFPSYSSSPVKHRWEDFVEVFYRYHNDEVFYMISATKSTKSGQIKGLTCQYYVNVLANLESQMQKKNMFWSMALELEGKK